MDEDEELYREMNEEDPFYMGDHDDNNEDDNECYEDNCYEREHHCKNDAKSNSGCMTVFFMLIIVFTLSMLI